MEILDDLPFIEIAYIRKSHGYRGHLRLDIDDNWLEDLKEQSFVFLEIDGYKVPFEIEELDDRKDVLVKLKTIDNPEELKKYPNKRLYLPTRDVKHGQVKLNKKNELSDLIGMHIHDLELGDLGPIVRVDQYPQQEMAILMNETGDEILIPLHPKLIEHIDQDQRVIKMDLPEGLV